MRVTTLTFVVLCVIATSVLASLAPTKRLAGPPEEFANYRIPDPSTIVTKERSASEGIWFDTSLEGNLVHSVVFPVDGPNEFVFTFASPLADHLTLELYDPNGNRVDLESIKHKGTFPIGETDTVPIDSYVVANSLQGYYKLNIAVNGLTKEEVALLAESPHPNAVLNILNNDYLELHTQYSSYILDVGDPFGVISRLVDIEPTADGVPPVVHVTHAEMDVLTPDGKDIVVEMRDDDVELLGEHGVKQGAYGAKIEATMAGNYLVQARLEGWIEGGVATEAVPFLRTTEHLVAISTAAATLTGKAQMRNGADANHKWIDLGLELRATLQPRLRAYVEVWGVEASTGAAKAVCWLGGLSELSRQAIGDVVSLELDLAWLQRAGVKGPLTLKNVYVSDISTSFPVTKLTQDIVVSNSYTLAPPLSPQMLNMTITKQMRNGINPLPKRNSTGRVRATPSLFLLPGYCAGENPWSKNSADFHGAAYFVEKGNFGHDEYSQKVLKYINSHDPESFSFTGHSQGGFVALHIANYYFTNLDQATGGRLIQSIGTPWQGCSAAGDAAGLGAVFGIGCGSNHDLTREGAANWLTGISTEYRALVHSYTTTYQQGKFFGDYCNLAMNIILQWPNDGTCELVYGKLPGGIYEGNTEKQCHTTGMAYQCQTMDSARNKLMNQAAAR